MTSLEVAEIFTHIPISTNSIASSTKNELQPSQPCGHKHPEEPYNCNKCNSETETWAAKLNDPWDRNGKRTRTLGTNTNTISYTNTNCLTSTLHLHHNRPFVFSHPHNCNNSDKTEIVCNSNSACGYNYRSTNLKDCFLLENELSKFASQSESMYKFSEPWSVEDMNANQRIIQSILKNILKASRKSKNVTDITDHVDDVNNTITEYIQNRNISVANCETTEQRREEYKSIKDIHKETDHSHVKWGKIIQCTSCFSTSVREILIRNSGWPPAIEETKRNLDKTFHNSCNGTNDGNSISLSKQTQQQTDATSAENKFSRTGKRKRLVYGISGDYVVDGKLVDSDGDDELGIPAIREASDSYPGKNGEPKTKLLKPSFEFLLNSDENSSEFNKNAKYYSGSNIQNENEFKIDTGVSSQQSNFNMESVPVPVSTFSFIPHLPASPDFGICTNEYENLQLLSKPFGTDTEVFDTLALPLLLAELECDGTKQQQRNQKGIIADDESGLGKLMMDGNLCVHNIPNSLKLEPENHVLCCDNEAAIGMKSEVPPGHNHNNPLIESNWIGSDVELEPLQPFRMSEEEVEMIPQLHEHLNLFSNVSATLNSPLTGSDTDPCTVSVKNIYDFECNESRPAPTISTLQPFRFQSILGSYSSSGVTLPSPVQQVPLIINQADIPIPSSTADFLFQVSQSPFLIPGFFANPIGLIPFENGNEFGQSTPIYLPSLFQFQGNLDQINIADSGCSTMDATSSSSSSSTFWVASPSTSTLQTPLPNQNPKCSPFNSRPIRKAVRRIRK